MHYVDAVPLLHGADFGHAAYLAAAIATHGLIGYTLATVATDAPPAVGALAGVAADVDLLFPHAWPFPLVHRGVTHTPAVLLLALAALYVGGVGRDARTAVGLGYLSQLVVDSFTKSGVMWHYPIVPSSYGVALGIHSPAQTAAVWAVALGALVARRRSSAGSDPAERIHR